MKYNVIVRPALLGNALWPGWRQATRRLFFDLGDMCCQYGIGKKNDVSREHSDALMELNVNGIMDTAM